MRCVLGRKYHTFEGNTFEERNGSSSRGDDAPRGARCIVSIDAMRTYTTRVTSHVARRRDRVLLSPALTRRAGKYIVALRRRVVCRVPRFPPTLSLFSRSRGELDVERARDGVDSLEHARAIFLSKPRAPPRLELIRVPPSRAPMVREFGLSRSDGGRVRPRLGFGRARGGVRQERRHLRRPGDVVVAKERRPGLARGRLQRRPSLVETGPFLRAGRGGGGG